jgi:protein gp37
MGATCRAPSHLLARIPATARFISYEPALGPLTLRNVERLPDWIICGGEDRIRPGRMMQPAWARALRDECADRGVAFFMKQMTGKTPIPLDLMVRQFPGRRSILLGALIARNR